MALLQLGSPHYDFNYCFIYRWARIICGFDIHGFENLWLPNAPRRSPPLSFQTQPELCCSAVNQEKAFPVLRIHSEGWGAALLPQSLEYPLDTNGAHFHSSLDGLEAPKYVDLNSCGFFISTGDPGRKPLEIIKGYGISIYLFSLNYKRLWAFAPAKEGWDRNLSVN